MDLWDVIIGQLVMLIGGRLVARSAALRNHLLFRSSNCHQSQLCDFSVQHICVYIVIVDLSFVRDSGPSDYPDSLVLTRLVSSRGNVPSSADNRPSRKMDTLPAARRQLLAVSGPADIPLSSVSSQQSSSHAERLLLHGGALMGLISRCVWTL